MKNSLLVLIGIAITLAASGLLIVAVNILLLVFAGLLFGVFLNGLTQWIAKRTPASYRVSYVLVVLALVLLLAAGSYYMGSRVVEQVTQLWERLLAGSDQIANHVERIWSSDGMKQFKGLTPDGGKVLPGVANVMGQLSWAASGAFVMLFVGLYVAFDPDLYVSGLVRLVPPDRRARAAAVMYRLRTALSKWIIGRLLSMSIIGVLTAIALAILNVPLPITLGVLAALLTFIPNLGPILAAIPQALLALNVGPGTLLAVLGFNVVLQGVESYLLTPMIQRYVLSLPPALTITAQLTLGATIGLIGVMMAAPLTAAITVIVEMLYIEDELGESPGGSIVDQA